MTSVLLARRTPAGHWEGHLASSALATATAVTALAAAARAGVHVPNGEALRARGTAWLIETADADGGWGDTPDSLSNISTTALVWAALAFESSSRARHAAASAEAWIARAAGGSDPERLAAALAQRYGRDRTFSVPILTMCAIAGRLGAEEAAWRLIPQLPFELAVLPRAFFGALRLPVVSYALPALISMGVARHVRGPRIPALSHVRELAVPKVLRVLDRLQPANGGFLEAIPLTSFVAMSLAAAGHAAHPAVHRGLDFIARSARDDGSWPIDTNLATWVTTLSVNAIGGALDGAARARLAEWLLRQQWNVEHPYTGAAPGGWAWTDLPGGVPDADDTAGAVLALAALGRSEPEIRSAAAAGIRWLLDLQNRDGGIPTFCRGWGALPFDRSASDLTAHALRAWSAWREELQPPLRDRLDAATHRAVAFLAEQQRADGAFVPLWFGNQRSAGEENPVYGTSRVLAGLAAVQGPSRERARNVAARTRRWLLAAQNADGGWGGAPGVGSSIEETAIAVCGLCAGGGPESAAASGAVTAGLQWLEGATSGFTRFDASPIGLYFARLWYAEALYPVIFTADALTQAARVAVPGVHPPIAR